MCSSLRGRLMKEWIELQKWQQDWLPSTNKPADFKDSIEKRLLLLERSPFVDRWSFTQAIQAVRTARYLLIQNFAYGFTNELLLDSSIASTPHLSRLLTLAQRGSGVFDVQRRFEALSLFDQALSVAKIEREDPLESIGHNLDQFIDLLSGSIFRNGYSKVKIYSYHDPENEYEVPAGNVGVGKQLRRRGMSQKLHRLTCRQQKNKEIVFMHHRIKDPFKTWLKMQKQVMGTFRSEPYQIHDRCGLMFIVPRRKSVKIIADKIINLAIRNGAIICETFQSNYGKSEFVDPPNNASSSRYKVAKVCIHWNGHFIELQFMTFYDYFSSTRSLSDVNHELYKLKQSYQCFFPLIWPKEVYGIDWNNGSIISQMTRWKKAQIGWCVKD